MGQETITSMVFMGIGLIVFFRGLRGGFMNSRRGRLWYKLFGETGTKIFYLILGLGFVIYGIYTLFDPTILL